MLGETKFTPKEKEKEASRERLWDCLREVRVEAFSLEAKYARAFKARRPHRLENTIK